MEPSSAVVYVALLGSSLYANKYILSVLGFQYPMVFQGWQTLVGFAVFKVLSYFGVSTTASLTSMDRAGFISLFPNFMLFVVYIIAGSRAVSSFPLLTFVCSLNVLPAVTFLIDTASASTTTKNTEGNTVLQRICSLLIVITAVVLVWVSERERIDEGDVPKEAELIFGDTFWLAVHIGCGLALSFHSRIADQRFAFVDRLFYSYVFALVVLAPASLYLEEAFHALKFRHRRQFRFLIGSVFSAGAGVALSLVQSKLKEDHSFGRLHHAGSAIAALVSGLFFATNLPWWAWLLAVVNLLSVIMVPTHLKPDEKIPASKSSPSLGTNPPAKREPKEDEIGLLEADEADLEVGMINDSAYRLPNGTGATPGVVRTALFT